MQPEIMPATPQATATVMEPLAPPSSVDDLAEGEEVLPVAALAGDLHHVVVVKIQPGHRVVGFWVLGLFLNGEHVAVAVKVYYAEILGIAHVIAEDSSAVLMGCGPLQRSEKP